MKDLVAKILAPQREVRVGGKIYGVRQHVPWGLYRRSRTIYDRIITENKTGGWLRRIEVEPILNLNGIDTSKLEDFNKRMRTLKIDLYKKYPDTGAQKFIRNELDYINKEVSTISSFYISLDHSTLEFFAEKRAYFYILKNSCRCSRSFNFLEKLYYKLLEDSVSLADIRKIARGEYWQNYWQTKKGGAFKYSPLTDEELALASYSRLYSNIAKHPDAPPREVIEDDDMLDGWLYIQNEEKTKQPSYGSKIDSAKEVFIMAKDQEHANKIYEMNSPEARAVQNIRHKQLQQQKTVPFGKFADVQRQRAMQNARQF